MGYPDCDFRGFDWYANNAMAVESCQMEAVAKSLRAQIAAGHETQFIKFTKDPSVNVYCLVDEEFLSNLQEEVNIRWKSYRINSLVNAVELIPAESQ